MPLKTQKRVINILTRHRFLTFVQFTLYYLAFTFSTHRTISTTVMTSF